MRLEVEDKALQILCRCGKFTVLIITAGLIMKSGHDDVAINRFSTAGAILQNAFGFSKVDKSFLVESFIYKAFGFKVI